MKHSQNLIYSEFLRECTLTSCWPRTSRFFIFATVLSYIDITLLSILAKIHEDKILPAAYLLTISSKIKCKIVPLKYIKAYG